MIVADERRLVAYRIGTSERVASATVPAVERWRGLWFSPDGSALLAKTNLGFIGLATANLVG